MCHFEGRFLKLLQLLSRIWKHRNRRGRIRSDTARQVAGCERVLEKRLLLSAVSSDIASVKQPAVEVESSPSAGGPVASASPTAMPSGDEVKPDAIDPSVPVMDTAVGETPSGAIGPVFQVETIASAAASSDSFRFDSDVAEVFYDVLAGLDVDIAIPADIDAFPNDRGVERLIEAESPLPQDEQPTSAAEDSSAANDNDSEVTEAVESAEPNEAQQVGLGGNGQSAGRSTDRSVESQRPLLGPQSFNADRASDTAHDFRYGHVDLDLSVWLNSALEERSSVHFRLDHQLVLLSLLGSDSGHALESLRASEVVWSELSGLSFLKQAQHRFNLTGAAANAVPAWLAQFNSLNNGTHFDRATVIARGFIEVAEPASQDSFDQPAKQTLIRIEAEIATLSADAASSDDPPERSDSSACWQSLRFDCNPRGPPGEDTLLISGFTRQTGGSKQLQQLRFSIAPRGPSVAFCFQSETFQILHEAEIV